MPNDDPGRLLRLIILFFKQFKGVAFDDHFRQEYGFDIIVRVRFTMEHEDLELPKKLSQLLQTLVAQPELGVDDKNLLEVCRLIELYRCFFGSSGSTAIQDDNTRLMKQTLKEIRADFKSQLEASQARH